MEQRQRQRVGLAGMLLGIGGIIFLRTSVSAEIWDIESLIFFIVFVIGGAVALVLD